MYPSMTGKHDLVKFSYPNNRNNAATGLIFQAGDSEPGRDLGATIGEGIFTHAASLEAGQAFYRDIKSRAEAKGRDPDHLVVMPGITVFVGDTDAEAREIERSLQLADQDFDRSLAELGRPFAWHDFRQYDLDAPFPDVLHVAERGFRTQAEKIVALARDHSFTLRETVQFLSAPKPTPFVGSPVTVADVLERWFAERPWTGPTSTSGTPPSSGGSPTRWCPSCASAAWSAPSTRPARCAGTWASRFRRTATPGPGVPRNRNS
jgi:alkanesulfonate monooxygenase SsuD/methylene tetrahydromethanopterin reductase-like flavin-dependent oxidoreductase (luciferase family)